MTLSIHTNDITRKNTVYYLRLKGKINNKNVFYTNDFEVYMDC